MTKLLYSANMFFMGIITLACFALWAVGRHFAFSEFSPFGYWNLMGGSIWDNVLSIGLPVIVYAAFLGQMDWFQRLGDDEGEISSENILFKGIVSLSAGVFEELLHRGVLIWIGLLVIFVSNFMLRWFIALVLLALVLKGFAARIWLGVVALVAAVLLWVYVLSAINNPIYLLNGITLWIYQWVVAGPIRLYLAYFLLIGLSYLLYDTQLKNTFDVGLSDCIHPLGILLRFGALLVWAGYAMPLGVAVLGHLPILPAGAGYWTTLLYVGAVIWSNVKFKEGHAYQGAVGSLSSYIFAFYMIHIAFTYGLLYAIILHFLFDLVLFTSEHLVNVIRNWRLAFRAGQMA